MPGMSAMCGSEHLEVWRALERAVEGERVLTSGGLIDETDERIRERTLPEAQSPA